MVTRAIITIWWLYGNKHCGHVRSRDSHMYTSMLVVNARFTTAFSITTWPTLCVLCVCVCACVCVCGCTSIQIDVAMLWYVYECVLVETGTRLPDSSLKSDVVYGDSHTRQLSMSLSYGMENKTTIKLNWTQKQADTKVVLHSLIPRHMHESLGTRLTDT